MYLYSLLQKANKICLTGIYTSLFVLGSFCVNQTAQADECANSYSEISTEKLARSLVKHFWNEVKEQNVIGYSHLITNDFQGINVEGIFNKEDQVSGLQSSRVTKFKLKDLIAARHGNTLVISYEFLAEGSGIVSGPSIDIWYKKEGHWKIISHSYVPFN